MAPSGNIDNFKGKNGINTFRERPKDINKRGRPLKIYTILKKQGFTADDISTAYNEMAFSSRADLIKIDEDESKPMIIRIVARQILKAYDDKNFYLIQPIAEHVTGRPTTRNEIVVEQNIEGITFDDDEPLNE